MLLTEREVRTGGYCTVELYFSLFLDRAVGEVHKQAKKERDLQYPPVRTEQAQSISYLLYGNSKNSGDIVNFFGVCSVLNLFHVVQNIIFFRIIRKHLDSPHSQTFQTVKLFHKTEFFKRI